MKKLLILLVFVGLLATNVASASFDKNLAYGSHGSLVKELQEFLTDQGVYSGPVSGNFYSLTLKAVKAFQSRETIKPSGYWNLATRTRANELLDLADSDNEQINEPTFIPPTFNNPWTPTIPVVVPTPTVQPSVPAVVVPKPDPIQPRKFFFTGGDGFGATQDNIPFILLEGLKPGVQATLSIEGHSYNMDNSGRFTLTDIPRNIDNVKAYIYTINFTYQDPVNGLITGTHVGYFAY